MAHGLASMLPPPKSKGKAPAKIMLDLPSAKNDEEDARPAKKLKLGGAGGSSSAGGLASMLPAPKNAPAPSANDHKLFVPKSVSSSKPKEDVITANAPQPLADKPRTESTADVPDQSDEEDEEEDEEDDEGDGAGMDFFGLGPVSSSKASASSSSRGKLKISSAPSVAAAPVPKPKEPTPPPAAQTESSDSNNGWRQMPSGEWVPTTQAAYEQMLAMQKAAPEGFSSADIGRAGGMAEIDDAARKAEIARERQRKLLRDGVAKASGSKAPPRPKGEISRVARQRHQLTSLIDDAARNHDLLEEKLAIARANKKGAGLKYGF